MFGNYPLPINNPESFSFPSLVSAIRNDPVLSDLIFLQNSKNMFPFQRYIVREVHLRKFVWIQAVRGGSKSWAVARALLDIGLSHQTTIVFAAPTYRQALHPFNYIAKFIEENSLLGGIDLTDELATGITRGALRAQITLKNGTRYVALPMGSGGNIRGERADILVIDEFFNIEREMYQLHVMPFLSGHKEEGSYGPKLIVMTSAEYQDNYAYSVLQDFLKKSALEDKLALKDPTYNRKYSIIDINVDDLQAEGYTVDWDILEQQLAGASEEERQQALYNKWLGRSGEFLPGNLLERTSSSEVSIEHEAQRGFSYAFAIDVATQLKGDYFVVDVLKFLPPRKMAVVYSLWLKGKTEDEMAWEIYKLDKKFNTEFIVMDKGGGGLFVRNALLKPKLVMPDGKEYEISNPILEHNESRALKGNRKLILNSPDDEMIRAAISADRSHGGDYISTEDALVHFIYDGLRKLLSNDDCPIMIPKTYTEDNSEGLDSNAVIHDRIKEGVLQLKHLGMKTILNDQGLREIVKGKNSKMPLYKWKHSVHDAASAFAYSYLAYRIHYRYGSKAMQPNDPVAVPTVMTAASQFKGMKQIYPSEIYRLGQ